MEHERFRKLANSVPLHRWGSCGYRPSGLSLSRSTIREPRCRGSGCLASAAFLRKVVCGLEPHPSVGVAPAKLLQGQRDGRRDSLLAVQQLGQCGAGQAEAFGAFGHSPAHRLNVVAQATAWVGWAFHGVTVCGVLGTLVLRERSH